jgi:hypothetical protein
MGIGFSPFQGLWDELKAVYFMVGREGPKENE